MPDFNSIPLELMEILNRINDNINEVKQRITRIEAQDHTDSIRMLKTDLEKERDARVLLQIEISNIKTRMAPIVLGLSMAAAGVVQLIIKLI